MTLRFYNTLSKKKQAFQPLYAGEVRMYNCGPTVYNYPHIGNYLSYCFADLLRRYLEYRGFKVIQVMNITDVDDKTIRDSKKEGKSLIDFTRFYEDEFKKDLASLNILPAAYYPRATEHIPEMAELIQQLLDKGVAYKSDDGSVYFKISQFPDYGKLSGVSLSGLEAGASGRVKSDEYAKESVSDFVLWKAWDESDGDVFWETSLGKGRPGWHIECSAMSRKYLGETLDIHTGGIDLIFPHHENEIGQSEAANGKKFVRYWLHNGHLMVDGRKMAKSLGNFYTLRDILAKGFAPMAVRYLFMSSHYRSQLNFTFVGLESASNTLKGLSEFVFRLGQVKEGADDPKLLPLLEKTQNDFTDAMDDDLNTSGALKVVFEFQAEVNRAIDASLISPETAGKIRSFMLDDFNRVFGVLSLEQREEAPEEVKKWAVEREAARKAGNYPLADELRQKIKAAGFIVEDSKSGPVLKRV